MVGLGGLEGLEGLGSGGLVWEIWHLREFGKNPIIGRVGGPICIFENKGLQTAPMSENKSIS